MASSPTPIGSILPIGPVAQSTSDSKQTPPFTKDAASRELRAAILKRRKESRVWFSKAAEKDKEQGTQLGTLGFLPWEIRQQIIGMFRPKNSHRNRRGAVLDRCDSAPYILGKDVFSGSWEWSYPGLGDVINFRGASASLGIEVEYNFYTLTDFRFVFPFEVTYIQTFPRKGFDRDERGLDDHLFATAITAHLRIYRVRTERSERPDRDGFKRRSQ